jgi:hypothetical protein
METVMDTKHQNYTVIMGDLVGSERSKPFHQLHAAFNQSVDDQNVKHKEAIKSPLTITLGDEFQGIAESLVSAIQVVRDMRLQLMAQKVDCRFVIGAVEIQTPFNRENAWNMMGPGLSRAREKLNEKRTISLYRFSLPKDSVTELMLDALGAGLTVIERSWTDQQRDDIAELLKGTSPSDIAKKRNVSVHSIYKVRSSGDFDAYVTQWRAISEALQAIDQQRKAR